MPRPFARACCFHALVLLGILVAFVPPTSAQETTGRLEGRVLDARGQPITDVNVTVTSPALQGGRGCPSNAQGWFVLPALPVGEYRVRLAHLAHQGQVLEGVPVRLAQTTSLGDVRLADRVIDQPEIVVTAERPLIDPTSTAITGVLTARDFEPLPVERDYRSAATLLPQVNASFLGDPVNIAGATGQDNRYYLDGVDGTDPVYGTNGASLPYNFVQEVEVRVDGYQAEYRGSLGGTLNAITYSGGNEPQVRTFSFYTRNRPAADPRYSFKPNKGDYTLYDVGAGIGGPIRRDALWYFLAYNPTITREQVEIAGLGTYPDHTTAHNLAGKLTWRVNDRSTAVLTAVGDPTTRDGVAALWGTLGVAPVSLTTPDPMLTDIRTGRFSVAADLRSSVRKDVALQSVLTWTRFWDRDVPATRQGRDQPFFMDLTTGEWSGGTPSSIDNRSTVADARVSGTWFGGAHEVKGGFEYRDIRWDFDLQIEALMRYSDLDYRRNLLRGAGRVGHRIPSAFLQDSWRLGDDLRVNLGLRWDGLVMVGSDGKVAQTILDQWQPRVGIVWQPAGRSTQKVSASAGRFYHDLSVWPLFWYYNAGSYQTLVRYDHDPRVDPLGGVPDFEIGGAIQKRIDGLKGQYYDGFTGGYEVQVAKGSRLALTLDYRMLGEALEDGFDPVALAFQFNNPGRGAMSAFPEAKHEYTAVTLSWQQQLGGRASVLASYVLSRNRGNYAGTFNNDFGYVNSNVNGSYDFVENLQGAYGLLPNDRTHVIKASGSHIVGAGLTLGLVAGWMSGTPLSEFGYLAWPPLDPVFVRPRGTNGRTPAIWDLSLRAGYVLPVATRSGLRPRVTVDALHIGSPERPVTYDQVHYLLGTAGPGFGDPSATYLNPTQYQPGFAVRVGAEVEF
jgi:hypothetical protein